MQKLGRWVSSTLRTIARKVFFALRVRGKVAEGKGLCSQFIFAVLYHLLPSEYYISFNYNYNYDYAVPNFFSSNPISRPAAERQNSENNSRQKLKCQKGEFIPYALHHTRFLVVELGHL
jgi:hypothetical protein